MQKVKWYTEEALQIAQKRREAEGKREKERYTYFNAEFQRIARRDKKSLPQQSMQRIRGGKNIQNYTKKIIMTQITTMV